MTTNLHDKMLAAIDAYFSASDGTEEEVAENLLLDVRDEINKQKYVPETNFGNMAEPKIGCVNHDCDQCKAVQEPVAWMHTMIDDVVVGHRPADLNVHPDRWMPLHKDPTPCQTCQALARTVMMDQTAHDTTPPAAQKPWVGLTDEEKEAIYRQADAENWHDQPLLEAVESKLKEKNT
jgi:hypothetical protein